MEKQELSCSESKHVLLESDIIMMVDILYCASERIKLKDSDSVYVYIGLVKSIAHHWAMSKKISIVQYKFIELHINICFRYYNSRFYDASIVYLDNVRNFVIGLI